MELKFCPDCGTSRPIKEFGKNKSRKDGMQSYCKKHSCIRYGSRRRKSDYPAVQRAFFMRWKYGITPGEFDELMQKQQGKCLICKIDHTEALRPGATKDGSRNSGLVVDHNHKSKVIRGLLCTRCNQGLGYFRDNPDFLSSAAEYLKMNGVNYTPSRHQSALAQTGEPSFPDESERSKSL